MIPDCIQAVLSRLPHADRIALLDHLNTLASMPTAQRQAILELVRAATRQDRS